MLEIVHILIHAIYLFVLASAHINVGQWVDVDYNWLLNNLIISCFNLTWPSVGFFCCCELIIYPGYEYNAHLLLIIELLWLSIDTWYMRSVVVGYWSDVMSLVPNFSWFVILSYCLSSLRWHGWLILAISWSHVMPFPCIAMPVPWKLLHNFFVVTRSWNLYAFLPSMIWSLSRTVQVIVSARGHQDVSSSSPVRLPGRPTSASTWPALALWGTLRPATPPPSNPCSSAYPMPSSWMTTPRTRMPAGCPSHGAPRVECSREQHRIRRLPHFLPRSRQTAQL
jgi:hypothetical protein